MKKLIVGALCGLLSFGVVANNDYNKNDEFCRNTLNIINLAKAIMEGRQVGVTIEQAIETQNKIYNKQNFLTDEDKKIAEALSLIHLTLLLEAYDKPKFETEKEQQKAIQEFGETAYLYCMKDLS